MSNAKAAILSRLREPSREALVHPERDYHQTFSWDQSEKIRRFTERMEAVRAQVQLCRSDNWIDVLAEYCQTHQLAHLLVSPATEAGKDIQAAAARLPSLLNYERPIEGWKRELFDDVAASFTTTLGGIAETGSLILWPTEAEPRLMSLVPPIHIALLKASQLHSTFAEVIKEQRWVEKGMPTNALLVSGPSKSADIEQTLAYGVHGPKELMVLVLEDA